MDLSNHHKAFLVSAAGGFLVWYCSKPLTGRLEPWDGNVLVYLIALLLVGFFSKFIWDSPPKNIYWGGYCGQVLFCLLQLHGGGLNLFPFGAVILLVYSLPVSLGAVIAQKLAARHFS